MFFSKKEYVCEKCGAKFTKRINTNGNLCDDCWHEDYKQRTALEPEVAGYNEYAKTVLNKTYTVDELKKIVNDREALISKNRNVNGITREELQAASDNYKTLTDEEAQEILAKVAFSSVSTTMGAKIAGNAFFPVYNGVVVDVEDVFAIAITSCYRMQDKKNEIILCAIFTNNPYVPVFATSFAAKLGFLEIGKSKKGREGIKEMLTRLCPNLTYPVSDAKDLKKIVKEEDSVRGKIDKKFMLDQISNLSSNSEMFDPNKMYETMFSKSREILDRMGYILEPEVKEILKMDKMFNRNFWSKHMDKLMK